MTGLQLRLSALDRDGYTVNLEPEGAEHEVPGGCVFTLEFPKGTRVVEVVWHAGGLSVFRDGNAGYPKVHTENGESLHW